MERRPDMGAAPSRYRITVRGRLTDRFETAFGGMTLEPGVGKTALVGAVADQSELYGLLDRLRDLGLELLCLEREPGG